MISVAEIATICNGDTELRFEVAQSWETRYLAISARRAGAESASWQLQTTVELAAAIEALKVLVEFVALTAGSRPVEDEALAHWAAQEAAKADARADAVRAHWDHD